MSENTTVNISETNVEQQNPAKPILENASSQQEQAPEIKSEENKANWKAFREQREAERKARIEAERQAKEESAKAEAMKAALEALTNKPYHHPHEPFEDNEETEEQRIDKRVAMALQKEREKFEKEHREREQKELPNRLQSTFGDFNKVCSSENLDYLEYHYPELSTPFKHMPDGFDKWAAIYKAVKRFVPNIDAKADQAKVERNLQKPSSPSSPGNTHSGNAMPQARLDEARKAANWERMQKALKGLS